MRIILYAVIAISFAAGAAWTAEMKISTGVTTRAVMTEDIYIEIKAHEAAFLAAAFNGQQTMEMDTGEQQKEALQFARQKQEEFTAVKKKLLAQYRVAEKDFDAYEARLAGESWNQANAGMQVQDIDLTNLKIDEYSAGMNETARRLAERIGARARELYSKY